MEIMTILITGASGLIGSHCLDLLLQDDKYTKIIALLRKPLAIEHPKLIQSIVDFDKLDNYAGEIKADAVLSMMGTTIKKAGTSAAFTKVDYGYQLKVAEIARRNGTNIFVLLSALSANKKSRVLYSRVKGEIEEAISLQAFEKLVILRPSLLLGHRDESRPGESIVQWIAVRMPFVFSGPFAKYKAISAQTVAQAMINAVHKAGNGIRIVENLEIFEWAKH